MAKKREMVMVIKKTTFEESEDEDVLQWADVPFEKKLESLERMRRNYYSFHNLPYPERMERVIKYRIRK